MPANISGACFCFASLPLSVVGRAEYGTIINNCLHAYHRPSRKGGPKQLKLTINFFPPLFSSSSLRTLPPFTLEREREMERAGGRGRQIVPDQSIPSITNMFFFFFFKKTLYLDFKEILKFATQRFEEKISSSSFFFKKNIYIIIYFFLPFSSFLSLSSSSSSFFKRKRKRKGGGGATPRGNPLPPLFPPPPFRVYIAHPFPFFPFLGGGRGGESDFFFFLSFDFSHSEHFRIEKVLST